MQFNFICIFKPEGNIEKVYVLQYHEKINIEDISLGKSVFEKEVLCN